MKSCCNPHVVDHGIRLPETNKLDLSSCLVTLLSIVVELLPGICPVAGQAGRGLPPTHCSNDGTAVDLSSPLCAGFVLSSVQHFDFMHLRSRKRQPGDWVNSSTQPQNMDREMPAILFAKRKAFLYDQPNI